MVNPLIPDILALLREYSEGLSEYDLLKALKKKHAMLNRLADDPNLQLFRQHFLIMNALYQLQTRLWQEEHITLKISGLNINLSYHAPSPSTSESSTLAQSAESKLAAYYSDWDEYASTDEADVERLLDSFYHGVANTDERKEALKTLALDTNLIDDKSAIKRQYRKLAHDAHPDHGGDPERFISLRQAYECLMQSLE